MSLSPNESKKVTDVLFKEIVRVIKHRSANDSTASVVDAIRTQLLFLETVTKNVRGKKKKNKKRKLSSKGGGGDDDSASEGGPSVKAE